MRLYVLSVKGRPQKCKRDRQRGCKNNNQSFAPVVVTKRSSFLVVKAKLVRADRSPLLLQQRNRGACGETVVRSMSALALFSVIPDPAIDNRSLYCKPLDRIPTEMESESSTSGCDYPENETNERAGARGDSLLTMDAGQTTSAEPKTLSFVKNDFMIASGALSEISYSLSDGGDDGTEHSCSSSQGQSLGRPGKGRSFESEAARLALHPEQTDVFQRFPPTASPSFQGISPTRDTMESKSDHTPSPPRRRGSAFRVSVKAEKKLLEEAPPEPAVVLPPENVALQTPAPGRRKKGSWLYFLRGSASSSTTSSDSVAIAAAVEAFSGGGEVTKNLRTRGSLLGSFARRSSVQSSLPENEIVNGGIARDRQPRRQSLMRSFLRSSQTMVQLEFEEANERRQVEGVSAKGGRFDASPKKPSRRGTMSMSLRRSVAKFPGPDQVPEIKGAKCKDPSEDIIRDPSVSQGAPVLKETQSQLASEVAVESISQPCTEAKSQVGPSKFSAPPQVSLKSSFVMAAKYKMSQPNLERSNSASESTEDDSSPQDRQRQFTILDSNMRRTLALTDIASKYPTPAGSPSTSSSSSISFNSLESPVRNEKLSVPCQPRNMNQVSSSNGRARAENGKVRGALKVATHQGSVSQSYYPSGHTLHDSQCNQDKRRTTGSKSVSGPVAGPVKTTLNGNRVRFSTATIWLHPMILGDSPSTSSGPPITLAWRPLSSKPTEMDINAFEISRVVRQSPCGAATPVPRRALKQLAIPRQRRVEILLSAGFTAAEIQSAADQTASQKAAKPSRRTSGLIAQVRRAVSSRPKARRQVVSKQCTVLGRKTVSIDTSRLKMDELADAVPLKPKRTQSVDLTVESEDIQRKLMLLTRDSVDDYMSDDETPLPVPGPCLTPMTGLTADTLPCLPRRYQSMEFGLDIPEDIESLRGLALAPNSGGRYEEEDDDPLPALPGPRDFTTQIRSPTDSALPSNKSMFGSRPCETSLDSSSSSSEEDAPHVVTGPAVSATRARIAI
jgi:hypothetical protein